MPALYFIHLAPSSETNSYRQDNYKWKARFIDGRDVGVNSFILEITRAKLFYDACDFDPPPPSCWIKSAS
jgi:hypothetical protein